MPTDPILDYATLHDAVAGSAAAFRLTLKLEAVSPKVFPPTYEGGKYATEERNVGGQKLPCVLLDSVPSQANRMELALQDSEAQLPKTTVDFTRWFDTKQQEYQGDDKKLKELQEYQAVRGITITSLQAPHRIADAILRDSTVPNGKKPTKFRESDIGKELDQLSVSYATPLLKYAPHCLVFGMWDSTGPRGGLGVKFSRAVVSEVIGVNAVGGVKTSSRIDPLNIRVNAGKLYVAKDGGWTLDEDKAVKKGKESVPLGTTEKKKGEGKPSEANHGNVTPTISDGGFTIDYAEQTTVLSLPALRRLRFPAKAGAKSTPEGDTAARAYLAALGLLGATLAVEAGYDLRSRCILRAKDAVRWELLGKPGDPDRHFALDKAAAVKLYEEALAAVQKVGLPLELDEITLTPSDDLVTLVKKSMELAAAEAGTEG